MSRLLAIALSLALTIAWAPAPCLAAEAGVFEGLTGPAVAQMRRRRRRRGRRSRPPAPPKPKAEPSKEKKEDDKKKAAAKDKKKDKKKAVKKKTKRGKKSKKSKKKRKKKAPKVSKKKGPFLPKNFGKIMLFSGSGVTALGLGVAAWGANVHNGAIAERQRLQEREANTANQMQAFYDLHAVTETGKTIHFVGLGLAGFGAVAAAVGAIL